LAFRLHKLCDLVRVRRASLETPRRGSGEVASAIHMVARSVSSNGGKMKGMESLLRARSTVLRGPRSLHGGRSGKRTRGRRHLHLVVGERAARDFRDARARILVTGGPRVGKTTFIGAASEVVSAALPAELLTPLLGDAAPAEALDLGHIAVAQDPNVDLWLVGTPGHRGCWPVWDVLRRDPATLIGAVVLVDVRRLRDCHPALAYLGRHRVPFVLTVNEFDRAPAYPAELVRTTLGLERAVPVVRGDARRRPDARRTLALLVEHSLGMPGPRPWDG
jgi:signal recognition particle receptor subunit beta